MRELFEGLGGILAAGLLLAAFSAPALSAEESEEPLSYTGQGADKCIECHDEESDYPVLSIFKTPHAVEGDERTPFADMQCEACHGPGREHAKRLRFGEERPDIPRFGDDSPAPTEKENKVCRSCHENAGRMHWAGSAHQRRGVGCADCHTVHAVHDPVTERAKQPKVCGECHGRQRAATLQASSHPIREGKMACSGCHEPHGSLTEAMLIRPTLNETCYTCHAEVRGPFLWEHAPVPEDCSHCHRSHGSNHPALLAKRPPLLCQQCHSRVGHPSIGRTGDDLASAGASGFLLGRSCTNCHSQVHGSNHPSGANLSR